ncbi:DNA-binding SARP family transcriptional activator [Marmoricola sp. OAE513]|uniref:BTAD domain-containing putative transcriptional regulator n=1 Tax=Marmoricola sp. OAE513 TaxID=2817894 RepID=UPI001AE27A40
MGPSFSLLGPLEVRSPSGELVHLGGPKPRGLLAMLLVHRGRPVSVDRLVHGLWGESPTEAAATTLRSHVVRVRRLLEESGTPATLGRRSGAYVLEVDPAEVDADVFEQLLGDGRAAAAAGRPHEAVALLDQALDLWRGDVLADVADAEFVTAVATDLAEKRLVAEEARLDVRLALGQHQDAVPVLTTLVEEHPFRERFAAQLVLALYRSGRQADALAVAAATRERLADELGLDPGAELVELETAVLRQDSSLDLAAVPVVAPSAAAAAVGSPLVERDGQRAVLARAIAGAASGQGRCVAVAGDAGVGKTSLVRAACADAPVRVLRGQCDPLTTPRSYGPLRDIASAAGITIWDSGAEVLLADVCDQVVAGLVEEPTVLVVEDLHWVDASTVEVLRFLARRSATLNLSLLVTYRDHEVGVQHQARPLLGDLARLDHGHAVQLDALTVDGVGELLGDSPLDPVRVHELTGGNPFFVLEVGSDPDRPLPATVRDALLARTADLSAEDLRVLQLASLSPERLDDAVIRVLGVDLPTLDRLHATGLLATEGTGLAFRHDLARQAVGSTIHAAGAPRLHAQVLDALEAAGCKEPELLTHHAVAALDTERAFQHAVAAAELAARAGAHTEAAAFFEIALHNQDDAAPGERARLLQRLAFEQYLISRLPEAIDNMGATFDLWEQAGDGGGLASAYDTAAVFAYYDADRRQAEAYADRAAMVAEGAGLAVPRGWARATRGLLGFFKGELDLARSCALEAANAADEGNDRMLSVRADMIDALAELATGDVSARPRLLQLIGDAREGGWDELASTGYSQLCSLDAEHSRIGMAQDVLDISIPFTDRRDLPICRHWQTAIRSRVALSSGRWDDALTDAGAVIGTAGMPVARLWPFLISGLVPVRLGTATDDTGRIAPEIAETFDRAWEMAVALDEPIRRLSALAVLAEVMWTTGIPDPRVTEHAVPDLGRLAGEPGAFWAAGELAVWLRRLGETFFVPTGLAEPHAASLTGRHQEAAAYWEERNHSFQAALCLLDSGDVGDRDRALAELTRLGAVGTVARLAQTAETVA